jgi:hypothetical protein
MFFYDPMASATQVSDDSVTSESNSETNLSTVPTICTIPTENTNSGTILHYDVNNDGPSRIEVIQNAEEFPVMNRMYEPHMNIEEELLGNENQFNKQIKRKMRKCLPIEMFTKCRPIIDQQAEFLRKNDELKLTYCSCCKERWFETEIKDGTSMCKRCTSSKRSDPHIAEFSAENDCDPFPDGCEYPHHLEKLSVVEELLIARCHVIMSMYRIGGGGTWKYKGQVLNVQQENKELLESILEPGDVLPRQVSTLPILWLRKQQGSGDNGKFKDLQVRRERVRKWLEFLIANNPLYKDFTIDENSLSQLPEDDSVLNMLSVHDEDEFSINGTSSTVGSQEKETQELPVETEISRGPEQGGATGTDSLVEEGYLGPTNLNNEEDQDSRLNNILRTHVEGTKENPIAWPAQTKFLNDYCTPALGCMAFPTLFPYGKGDWFNQERRVEVTLGEYNKHMLKYALKNPKCDDELEPEFLYPFAEHDRWVNWAQNIGERHRLNGQRDVYLQKNPEDANLNETELRKIVGDNGPELKKN